MNKMTLVHIGIFTAGVVAGWMLAKNQKGFANVGGPIHSVPSCSTQCSNVQNYPDCLTTCNNLGATRFLQHNLDKLF